MKKQRIGRQFAPVWLIGLLLWTLAGCGTSSRKLNELHLGMTKPEVIQTIGNPAHTSAQGSTEYLGYNLNHQGMSERREFVVKLVDGKVDAFGEKADFVGQGRLVPPQTNAPTQAAMPTQTPWAQTPPTRTMAAGPVIPTVSSTATNDTVSPSTNAVAATNAAPHVTSSTNAPPVVGAATNAPVLTNVPPVVPPGTNAPAGTNSPAVGSPSTNATDALKPIDGSKPTDVPKPGDTPKPTTPPAPTNTPPAEPPGDPVTPADPPKNPAK